MSRQPVCCVQRLGGRVSISQAEQQNKGGGVSIRGEEGRGGELFLGGVHKGWFRRMKHRRQQQQQHHRSFCN
jgi:hypothetical protein